jgi:hypothetical protein
VDGASIDDDADAASSFVAASSDYGDRRSFDGGGTTFDVTIHVICS